MPLYEYRCKACAYSFEKIQSFSSEPERLCPKCGGELVRPLSAPALQFKGAGWYINDYSSKGKASASAEAAASDGAASSQAASSAPASSGGAASEKAADSAAGSHATEVKSADTAGKSPTPASAAPASTPAAPSTTPAAG